MSLFLSTAFRASLLGPVAFEAIIPNAKAVLYAGTQPSSADQGVGAAVVIGRITTDGLAYNAETNGLNFARTGRVVYGSSQWMLQGTASGIASFVRLMSASDDGTAFSLTLPRIDFPVFPIPAEGESLPGSGLALPSVTITASTSTPIDAFYYSIPPL